MTPTTEPAIRIAQLFNRRLTTHWSEKEVRAYKKLAKDKAFQDPQDLALIERYYRSERQKEEKGIHRRDLQTFLNNYLGELDRARAWLNKHFARRGFVRPKTVFTDGTDAEPVSDEEFQRIGELAKQEMERFRTSLRHEN